MPRYWDLDEAYDSDEYEIVCIGGDLGLMITINLGQPAPPAVVQHHHHHYLTRPVPAGNDQQHLTGQPWVQEALPAPTQLPMLPGPPSPAASQAGSHCSGYDHMDDIRSYTSHYCPQLPQGELRPCDSNSVVSQVSQRAPSAAHSLTHRDSSVTSRSVRHDAKSQTIHTSSTGFISQWVNDQRQRLLMPPLAHEGSSTRSGRSSHRSSHHGSSHHGSSQHSSSQRNRSPSIHSRTSHRSTSSRQSSVPSIASDETIRPKPSSQEQVMSTIKSLLEMQERNNEAARESAASQRSSHSRHGRSTTSHRSERSHHGGSTTSHRSSNPRHGGSTASHCSDHANHAGSTASYHSAGHEGSSISHTSNHVRHREDNCVICGQGGGRTPCPHCRASMHGSCFDREVETTGDTSCCGHPARSGK